MLSLAITFGYSCSGFGEIPSVFLQKLDKAFRTFPLESTEKADSETKIPRVPCPSLEDVEAAKEWVDFKEM